MKNFQVIGRCVKTQTLSLEDEVRLLDGVPYDIDFSDGVALTDVSATDIIEAILSPPKVPVLSEIVAQSYSEIDWDAIDKKVKKDRKHEKKWVKEHKKISPQEALKNLNNLLKEWGIHD